MVEIIVTVFLVYIFYDMWISINYDKKGNCKRKNKNKIPSEAQYFISKYKIDLKKINFRYFLRLIGLVVSVNIAVTAAIISNIKPAWLELLVGAILIVIIMLISFKLLGIYFKKKGLLKND